MRGTNTIRITGRILNKSFPIGADTIMVSVTTRIFMISTTAARGEVGIKDSRASVLLEPLVLPVMTLKPLVMAVLPLKPPALAFVALKPLVQAFRNLEPLVQTFRNLEPLVQTFRNLEPLVLGFINLEPLVLGFINLKKLLMVKKNRRSSSPAGVNSQIAQPGRSGIILPANSRSSWFDH